MSKTLDWLYSLEARGSVASMLDAIARAAGLRCGLYTKPHLVHPTERTRIDGAETVEIVNDFRFVFGVRVWY
jgi:folylpolyglutamate synthase/dihydropteroate synthase